MRIRRPQRLRIQSRAWRLLFGGHVRTHTTLADTWAKMVKEDGWNLWLGPVAPTCDPDLAWLINDQVAGGLINEECKIGKAHQR